VEILNKLNSVENVLKRSLPVNFTLLKLSHLLAQKPMMNGRCHHGVARPQVADGGTASDMEGSCEYIE
jgi:hypothetical protein